MLKFQYFKSYLPNQKLLSKFYIDKNLDKNLYKFIIDNSSIILPKNKFKIISSSLFSLEEMASNPISLQFLKWLIIFSKPKNVLEIGCFVGLSTMEMASALNQGSKITTIEKFKDFADIAKKNFKVNKLNKKIILINDDAINFLKKKNKTPYDIIFIDGDKVNYLNIFKLCEKVISKNGFFIIDNIFNQGDSINKYPQTSRGLGVKKLVNYLRGRKDLVKCILPFYDGLMLVKKI